MSFFCRDESIFGRVTNVHHDIALDTTDEHPLLSKTFNVEES